MLRATSPLASDSPPDAAAQRDAASNSPLSSPTPAVPICCSACYSAMVPRRSHFCLHRVQQLPPTVSEELPTTPISVIAAVEPMTSAHHLGGTPHTADLPQGR